MADELRISRRLARGAGHFCAVGMSADGAFVVCSCMDDDWKWCLKKIDLATEATSKVPGFSVYSAGVAIHPDSSLLRLMT